MNNKTLNTILRLLIYVAIGFAAAYFWKKMKNE